MAKLQNIKALKQMLRGEHKIQTKTQLGYEEHKLEEEHNEGDVWEENGKIWTIKNGIKISKKRGIKASELYSFPNCQKDKCIKNQFNTTIADKQIGSKTGMCLDCTAAYETKLRINGEYEEYENRKITENAVNMYKQHKLEFDLLKDSIQHSEYINTDGTIEDWNVNVESVLNSLEDGWKKYEEDFFNNFKENIEKYNINLED